MTLPTIEQLYMNEQLKPCPFCGGDDVKPWFNDVDERGEVYCTKCPCCVQSYHVGWWGNQNDRTRAINTAITVWNTRTNADTCK